MHPQTQLLSTFTNPDGVAETVVTIQTTYQLQFNKVYVLQNTEDDTQLILTYNVLGYKAGKNTPPESTISVHRKKHTNTIYTINAINKLIEEKNGGILDTKYQIDWQSLKNTILVTAYGRLKVINTKLVEIVELAP